MHLDGATPPIRDLLSNKMHLDWTVQDAYGMTIEHTEYEFVFFNHIKSGLMFRVISIK